MSERANGSLESCRENLVQFFGDEKVMGVDEPSERLHGLVRSQGERAKVVRDVLALVFPASHEWLAKDV